MITPEQARNALYEIKNIDTTYEVSEGLDILQQFIKETSTIKVDNNVPHITPEQHRHLVDNWIGTLRMRFGGKDFWCLSKKWKDIRYAEMAEMIVSEMEWIFENNDKL